MKFKVESICRSHSMSAMPMERLRLDLEASEDRLRSAGYAVDPQEMYFTVKMDGRDITVYPGGRVLIYPMNDKNKAKELAQQLFAFLVVADE